MEIRTQLFVSIIICLISLDGFSHWDYPHSNNVASCKTELSDLSVEELSEFIKSPRTDWRRKLALEELSVRNTSKSLMELNCLEKEFSKQRYLEASELCAKIAVDRIRRTAKNNKESVDALTPMLYSEKHGFLDASARELYEIGTSEAREALFLRETKGKGSITAKMYRYKIDIKNLSMDEAVGVLFEPIHQACRQHGTDADRYIVAERACLQGLSYRDRPEFFKSLAKRHSALIENDDHLSDADIRYGEFLEEVMFGDKQWRLPVEDAIDFLLESIRKSLSLYGEKSDLRIIAERRCLRWLYLCRDKNKFLEVITERQAQLLEKGDPLSDVDIRLKNILHEYSVGVKKHIRDVKERQNRLIGKQRSYRRHIQTCKRWAKEGTGILVICILAGILLFKKKQSHQKTG